MRFFQRSLLTIGLAAFTPALMLAAIQLFFSLQTERDELQTVSLTRAKQVQQLADARLQTELGALRILATSAFLAQRNWTELYARIKRAQAVNPAWICVVLDDTDRGEQIFDTRLPLPAVTAQRALEEGNQTFTLGEPRVSGAVKTALDAQPHVYVRLPVSIGNRRIYALTVVLDTQVFQDILMSTMGDANAAALVDRDGNFIARSPRYAQMLGRPATRFVRDAIATGESGVYHGTTHEGLENYAAFYKSAWSGWSAHIAVAAAKLDILSWWSFAVIAIAGFTTVLLAGVLVRLVLRNVAELRTREDALRQAQKMEAVGRLTAGIAHDFNNLLTAIIGNLDLIRSRAAGNERIQRLSANASEAARRAEKLTSRLLAFSREQRLALRPVDIDQLLRGMNDLLHKSLGPRIALQIAVDPDAGIVVSDGNQLELALLNLAVNARDAMPDGGKFSISTRLVNAAEAHLNSKHEFVEIAVRDTGRGMSEETRGRALEPFFTTKPLGQGTGLGLSQVFAVVSASGGSVRIDSKPGEGTTIRLFLPGATERHPKTIPGSQDSPPTVRISGSEAQATLLVVDDDQQVRSYIVESLRDFRYRVFEASSGLLALQVLQTESIDLMIVDFAMPGMNGAEVAHAARMLQPSLRILMVSGYADTAVVEAAIGPRRLLRKPFNVGELSAAVGKVLQDLPLD